MEKSLVENHFVKIENADLNTSSLKDYCDSKDDLTFHSENIENDMNLVNLCYLIYRI
jgi:hypothetical protein